MGDRSRRIGDAFPRRAAARALQRLRQAAGQAARVSAAEMLRGPAGDPARRARFFPRFVIFQGLAARKSFLRVAQPIRFARCRRTGHSARAIPAADSSAIGWSKFSPRRPSAVQRGRRFQFCIERFQIVRRLFLQHCPKTTSSFSRPARSLALVSRAPAYYILWVRGFRAHTISGRGFNLFKPLRRHFRATLPNLVLQTELKGAPTRPGSGEARRAQKPP
jgi:hypothetical protein